MLIDWFTVGAQALNFITLVWLLKRFLYQPILDAVDARETRIAKERADADRLKAEAGREHDTFNQKNAAFDQGRAALLRKASEDADAERVRLIADARVAADSLSAKRRDALQSDAQRLTQAITTRTEQEVYAVARKALRDLANADLDELICGAFAVRLSALESAPKATLAAAIAAASEPPVVRTASAASTRQRQTIQDAFAAAFATSTKLRFETSPALIGGVELAVGGQKIAWSIADYLTSLEKDVGALLKAETPPSGDPAAEPAAKQTAMAS
jgi:F-type H+-transporting ATPase subunit b